MKLSSFQKTKNIPYLEYWGHIVDYVKNEKENEDLFVLIKVFSDGVYMGTGYSSLRAEINCSLVYPTFLRIEEIIKITKIEIPEFSILE